jgi:DNA gyrase subunit A
MKQSFLDYSMSVIVQRALPDVRDGLKPVHRRILYSMHETGLSPTRPFKKSATVVGDVLGKYHPHGDRRSTTRWCGWSRTSRCATRWSQGQGNFGSIDGDSRRPTGTRRRAGADRDGDAGGHRQGDGRLRAELRRSAAGAGGAAGKVPNLLINGSSGIAVGMSTNIPPHNLREVVRAAIHLLDTPTARWRT